MSPHSNFTTYNKALKESEYWLSVAHDHRDDTAEVLLAYAALAKAAALLAQAAK